MGLFLKIFFGFWVIWIIWYLTGGPLRNDTTKPFVGVTKEGGLQEYSTSTLPK
jgi:hypothetical protein